MYNQILKTAKVIVLTKNDDGTFKLESDVKLSNDGDLIDAKMMFNKVVPNFEIKIGSDKEEYGNIIVEDDVDEYDDQFCNGCGNHFTFCECDRIRR